MDNQKIRLTRDIEVIQIPSGNVVTLMQGIEVMITQSLGGAYTVHAPTPGGLFRIKADDADALGLKPEETVSTSASSDQAQELTEEIVWDALKKCYDPEIPVNIVDLGLIYGMNITSLPSGRKHVSVQMTLTAPGCGMGPSIAQDAKNKILDLSQVEEASVELVWTPPWSPDRISQEGRIKLGIE